MLERVEQMMHRFAHLLGWNRCKLFGNGYICIGCGKYTPWESSK